jgi:leader peptidase (prepilin peptidase)/N-methyltransferase
VTRAAVAPQDAWPGTAGVAAASAVLTGGLCALAAVRLGAVPALGAYCALLAGLVALSITDLRSGLVPRRFVYGDLVLVAVGLAAASATGDSWAPLLRAAIGAAASFAVFAAIWWVYPKGLGFGDVRLAGLCGAGLGWIGYPELYLGFMAGFVIGAITGLAVLAVRRSRRFPFAPALAAGTALGVLWGGWLADMWLHPG